MKNERHPRALEAVVSERPFVKMPWDPPRALLERRDVRGVALLDDHPRTGDHLAAGGRHRRAFRAAPSLALNARTARARESSGRFLFELSLETADARDLYGPGRLHWQVAGGGFALHELPRRWP